MNQPIRVALVFVLFFGCGGDDVQDGGALDGSAVDADISRDATVDDASTDGGPDVSTDGGPGRDAGPVTRGRPGDPVVLFSDLTAAPRSGWSSADPGKGAVVTIWGRHFGELRGDSFVTVNGTDLSADVDYVDTWGELGNPVPFLETITFQLNDTIPEGPGEIRVTVGGVESNAIPFRIGAGNIYFVDSAAGAGTGALADPWGDLSDFIDVMAPGDIAYFREGTYDQRYNGGKSNIWVRDSEAAGTEEQPIAFVGYPNEMAMFDSVTSGDRANFNKSIKFDARYITVAKVSTRALGPGIQLGRFGRSIGNDVVGAIEFISGTGIIVASDGAQILGNSLHGARSGNRLDHSIYLSGCSPTRGGEVAYNHSFDQFFDRGPHFVVNSQESRCAPDEQLKSHSFHHNIVDCTGSPSRAIGVYDQSWDPGEAQEPEPTYVYNNLIIRCGGGAMYHNNGHAVFANNTLFETDNPGISVTGGLVLSTVIVNNIITMASGSADYVTGSPSTEDYNLYFGGDDSGISGSATNVVMGDPLLVMNLDTFLFDIQDGSSAIDAGDPSLASFVFDDFLGRARPQGSGYDIGAIEYLP